MEDIISNWKPAFEKLNPNQSPTAARRTIDSADCKDFVLFGTSFGLCQLISCSTSGGKKWSDTLWTEFNQVKWESEAKDCTGRVRGGCHLRKLCIWALSWRRTNWFKGLFEPCVPVPVSLFMFFLWGPKRTFNLLDKKNTSNGVEVSQNSAFVLYPQIQMSLPLP